MKCTEKDCDGETDEQNMVILRTGCGGCGSRNSDPAYPCKKCGRLHWGNGNPVFSRSEEKAFLVDGNIVHKR